MIGGIIGTDIVRYDIYGKDVMIANKMESNGAPGKINISLEVKNVVEKNFAEKFFVEKNKEIALNSFNDSIESFFIYQNVEI